ncbi:MAG TPA: choice-of-anchor D domain-containing protein [Candidatus Limnocylindrales bacterium]
MPAGGSSGDADRAELQLGSPTGAAEIAVVDSDFRPVAAGIGTLIVRLDPGIYEVVARAGPVTERRLVRLTPGERRSILDLEVAFPSAAPVPGTSTTHEYHQGLAAQATQLGEAPRAGYGGLVVVLRDVRGLEGPPLSQRDMDELALLDSSLAPFADFRNDWQISEQEAWASWGRHVPAGGYALRRTLTVGDPAVRVDQSVWVVSGWQTILFLTRPADGESAAPASVHTVPLSEPWRSFDPRIGTAYELIQWDLRATPSGYRGLPDVDLDGLIDAVADNAMLGIALAHLLLRQPELDAGRIGRLIAALDRLVPGHPDVLGLRIIAEGIAAIGIVVGDAIPPVSWPPMVLASYLALLRRDADVPGTIAPASVAESVAEGLLVDDIWTTWRAEPGRPDRERRGAAADEVARDGTSAEAVLGRIGQEPDLLRSLRLRSPAERRVAGYMADLADLAEVDPDASVASLSVGDVARATHLPHAVGERALVSIGLQLPEPPAPAGSTGGGRTGPPPPHIPILPLLAIAVLIGVVGGAFRLGIIGRFAGQIFPAPTAPSTPFATEVPTAIPTVVETIAPTPVETPAPVAALTIPPSLDFGRVEVPNREPLDLVIFNSGGLSVAVNSVQLTAERPEFFVDAGDCLTQAIQPGDSCRAQVIFRPTTSGDLQTDLLVATDALPSQTIHLTGSGVETGELKIDPPEVDFVMNTVAPVQKPATLVATGPLTITGFSIEGTYASEFSLISALTSDTQSCTGLQFARSQACYLTVQYTPPASNWNFLLVKRDALLVIHTASGRSWTITLVGYLNVIS